MKSNTKPKSPFPHNYQDLLLKNLTDNYLDSLQKILKIDIKQLRPVSGEVNSVMVTQEVLDRAFECPDGSIVDFEFDSTGKVAALRRYISYTFMLLNNNLVNKKIIAPVTVFVIYPAGVKIPKLEDLLIGNKIFSIYQKFLADLINGEELLKNLQTKIDSGINHSFLKKMWLNYL
jgi:hypothetical protein